MAVAALHFQEKLTPPVALMDATIEMIENLCG